MKQAINIGVAVAVLIGVWAPAASAGRKDSSPVAFFYFGTEGSVSGSYGSTRNSLSTTSYLRCESHFGDVNSNTTVTDDFQGSCAARAGLTSDSCSFPP